MNKGDIVIIPFPFTDISGIKNRPALLLADGEVNITVSFITTPIMLIPKPAYDTLAILKIAENSYLN